jgi:DNA-directed RNA polymerase specialized sigma24 family protein
MPQEFNPTNAGPVAGTAEISAEPSVWDEMFDQIAAGLYNLASMLVGEGEASVSLVEAAIAAADVSVCQDPALARQNSCQVLCRAAIALIAERNPASLTAPEGVAGVATCIEDDDLSAAGVSRQELERMMSGPDRVRVKNWLEGLPMAVRTVFVLRAVAGLSGAETAGLLAELGGSPAAGWTPDGVREYFQQGLCSLASQLIHAAVR